MVGKVWSKLVHQQHQDQRALACICVRVTSQWWPGHWCLGLCNSVRARSLAGASVHRLPLPHTTWETLYTAFNIRQAAQHTDQDNLFK